MNPEQSMQNYLAECEVHAEVLNQGMADVQEYLPLSAKTGINITNERAVSNRTRIHRYEFPVSQKTRQMNLTTSAHAVELNPGITRRELAKLLGVSNGKTNYLIAAIYE